MGSNIIEANCRELAKECLHTGQRSSALCCFVFLLFSPPSRFRIISLNFPFQCLGFTRTRRQTVIKKRSATFKVQSTSKRRHAAADVLNNFFSHLTNKTESATIACQVQKASGRAFVYHETQTHKQQPPVLILLGSQHAGTLQAHCKLSEGPDGGGEGKSSFLLVRLEENRRMS